MIFEKLGNSVLIVSKIVLETWGIGGGSVWTDRNLNERDVSNLLSVCLDNGINNIDTAPVYGTGISEELLGKVLQGRRQNIIL